MKRKYTREEVIRKLIEYYTKYKKVKCGINVKVDIEKREGKDIVIVTILQKRVTMEYGREHITYYPITRQDVTEIFNVLLREEGYDLKMMRYNTDIKVTHMDNDIHVINKRPYFKGVTVRAKERVKKLVGW